MSSFVNRIIFITNILLILAFVPIFANAEQNSHSAIFQAVKDNALEKSEIIEINGEKYSIQEEEKLIISIVNFGRNNPFKPYKELDLIKLKNKKDGKKKDLDFEEIPYPPTYEEGMREEIEILKQSVVNGILYDPYAKSVAIVKINGSEYMMHKGDMVEGITVNEILENKITLKYNSNTYNVGVGEVIEGSVQYDPVDRKDGIFGGSNYKLPDIEPEE